MLRTRDDKPFDFTVAWLGANPDLVELCPRIDRFFIRALWVPILGLWAWQTWLFTVTLHEAFAPDGPVNVFLIALGLFISSMVMIGEIFVFIRPSWQARTQRLIEMTLDNAPTVDSRPSHWQWVARMTLLAGAAILTGSLGAEQIYKPEIERQIAENQRAANADNAARATERTDAALQANRQSFAIQQKRLERDEEALAALRAATTGPGPETPEIKRQVAEIDRLILEKSRADHALLEAQQFASNELAGINGPGLSGLAGEGPRRTAALERVSNAEAVATAAVNALKAAQNRLYELQAAAAAALDLDKDNNQARLQELLKDRDAAQAEIMRLNREYQQLLADRENAIAASLARDPTMVSAERGLTARISALWQIAWRHPADIPIIVAVHLLLIGIDLLAILATAAVGVATSYIRLAAFEEVSANDAMARELTRRLGIGRPPVPPADIPPAAASKVEIAVPALIGAPVEEQPPAPPPQPPRTPTMSMEWYARNLWEETRKFEDERERLEEEPKPSSNVIPLRRGRGRPAGSKNRPKPEPEPHKFSKSSPAKPAADEKADDDKGPEGDDKK